jgi:hypothetical protein
MSRDADAALALATRVGHHRAAIIALHAACFASIGRLDLGGARARIEQAHALTLRIGARRFEAENVLMMASIARLQGRRDEAAELAAQAMRLSRETAVSYIGPCVLGFVARVSRDPAERRDAIAEGEALLAQGAVSHNFLWFRRDAIEAALAHGDWDEAERHAAELERYAAVEPSPWTRFYVARGRALAAHGRAPRDQATVAELRRFRRQAAERGLAQDLPALDAALAA